MEMTNIGVENLSGAIVAQAAKDYYGAYKALRKLERLPLEKIEEMGEKYEKARTNLEYTILEVKRFFFSDWFMLLSSMNPDALIDTIEAKVESDLLKKEEATEK